MRMFTANWASDASELIRAIATLWPLFLIVILWSIRKNILDLLPRIRIISGRGFSALLAQDVETVQRETSEIQSQIEHLDVPERVGIKLRRGEIDEVLETSAQDPRLGLIQLVMRIEARTRDLAAISGHESPSSTPWRELLTWLVKKGTVPKGVASASTILASLRNKIVHGDDQNLDKREITAVVDAGIGLYRVLLAIPQYGYSVDIPNVPLYEDDDAQKEIEGVHGVVLRNLNSSGQPAEVYHVRPTRTQYQKGLCVGWQWSFDEIYGNAWWRDPYLGNAIKHAWSESAEFVGQPLRHGPPQA